MQANEQKSEEKALKTEKYSRRAATTGIFFAFPFWLRCFFKTLTRFFFEILCFFITFPNFSKYEIFLTFSLKKPDK